MIYPLKNWPNIRRAYKFGDKTFYSDHHLGTDYMVPEGTPIYAPANCEIIKSQKFLEGGNTIHILLDDSRYGRLILRCMHLKELPKEGKCSEGDFLGYSGNTGRSTGPHLHLDISKDDIKIDQFNNFIDPEIFFSERINKVKYNNIITYKKDNEPAIYILIGDILIPFITSYDLYKKEFGDAEIIILSESKFNKFRVSTTVWLTPKV